MQDVSRGGSSSAQNGGVGGGGGKLMDLFCLDGGSGRVLKPGPLSLSLSLFGEEGGRILFYKKKNKKISASRGLNIFFYFFYFFIISCRM